MTAWYQDHVNLHELASWMLETDPMFTVLDVMDYLEAPWEYQHKWNKFQEVGGAVGCFAS